MTIEAPLLADSEHRSQDHRQGDPLGVGAKREGLADRPGLDVAVCDLADQIAVAVDALTVERRQQQLALAKVLVLVEGEDGVRPQRGLDHGRVRLAGVVAGRVAGEDLLDQTGVGDVDDAAEVRK